MHDLPDHHECGSEILTKRVAVIGEQELAYTRRRCGGPANHGSSTGAGSAGASTAYYISRYGGPCVRTNITVYERSAYVGGRSTTVNVYGDPAEPVELGASIFVEANRNLVSAAKRFGLSIEEAGSARPKESSEVLGVWDGERFVFVQSNGGNYWWSVAKLVWRYGFAPIRTQRLMKRTVGKFMKMYESPYFPFRSLSQTAYDLGLTAVTATPGNKFLMENQISGAFATDIIQASTRVNYGQNLGSIHGLETMVCMATDGAMAIKGGNWQIFDGMLRTAGANVALNTSVSRISRRKGGTFDVRYQAVNGLDVGIDNSQVNEYDTVVLAAPLQFSGIDLSGTLSELPDKIPYVELHVTLFASPHKLSPPAFNLAEGSSMPDIVLTTLPNGADHGKPGDEAGLIGFFSISTLRSIANPAATPPRMEYLYKIFSPKPLTSAFVARLLGVPVPGDDLSSFAKDHVSWLHEKKWHSYPYLYPRVTFDDPQLDWNLWYTSGVESFISTMETSSLMGKNVARLILDDWLGITREGPAPQFDRQGTELLRCPHARHRYVENLP